MSGEKIRAIKDYDKLDPEIQEQIKLVYPEGYSQHLIRFKNKNGDMVSALPFETEEKIYLIRMSIDFAEQLILDDDDYDEDGSLIDDVKEKYEDKHSEVEYLSENDNYSPSDDDL
mgnify:CR=1 FL=1